MPRPLFPDVLGGILAPGDGAPITDHRLRRAFACFSLAVCLAFAIPTLFFSQTDYAVYRLGARAILDQAYLYDVHRPPTGLAFTYPPFAALPFCTFLIMPVRVGQFAWALLTLIATYAFLRVFVQRLNDRISMKAASRAAFLLLGLVVLLEPFRKGMSLGQINVLIALFVFADLSPTKYRYLPKGVLIGLAAGIKLTPLIFIPYLVMTGRARRGLVALLAFASTVGIGFVVTTRASVDFWSELIFEPGRVGGIEYVGNQSLTGVFARWLGAPPGAVAWYAVLAGVLIVGVVTAVRVYQTIPLAADVLVGLTALLVSPISWSHHFVWLAPALLLLLAKGSARIRQLGILGAAVTYAAPIWWVPNGHHREYHHNAVQMVAACSFAVVTVGAMIGLIVIARNARRQWQAA